jgi:hypothetical protein
MALIILMKMVALTTCTTKDAGQLSVLKTSNETVVVRLVLILLLLMLLNLLIWRLELMSRQMARRRRATAVKSATVMLTTIVGLWLRESLHLTDVLRGPHLLLLLLLLRLLLLLVLLLPVVRS